MYVVRAIFGAIAASLALMTVAAYAAPTTKAPSSSASLGPDCVALNAGQRYAESLTLCSSAANGFREVILADPANWFGYYQEGRMLAYAAADLSALGHHRQALQVALSAHQLELRVSRFPTIGDDDRVLIVDSAAQLRSLEVAQEKFIAAHQGD